MKQEEWIQLLLGEDLVKSERGAVRQDKGRANSGRVKLFADHELPVLKDHLYDALSHHLSGYYYHLKKNDPKTADKHMRYFHQYMDLAERLANENPEHMKVSVPADPQHWEQNAKTDETGKPTKSALHGWSLNQTDYSHLRQAPHAKFTQRIQGHGHNGAYPLEKIKINGKYLTVDPDNYDPEPSGPHPKNRTKQASMSHNHMDYHPIMKSYDVDKKSVPYFALSNEQHNKIKAGGQKDRWGKTIEGIDIEKDYDDNNNFFINKVLPAAEQIDRYYKEHGEKIGKTPHTGVHAHLNVKKLNLNAAHEHQNEVNTGKAVDHMIINRKNKTVHLSTGFLKNYHTSPLVEHLADNHWSTIDNPENLKYFHKDSGEEIPYKDLKKWYKQHTEGTSNNPEPEEPKAEKEETIFHDGMEFVRKDGIWQRKKEPEAEASGSEVKNKVEDPVAEVKTEPSSSQSEVKPEPEPEPTPTPAPVPVQTEVKPTSTPTATPSASPSQSQGAARVVPNSKIENPPKPPEKKKSFLAHLKEKMGFSFKKKSRDKK